MTKKITIIGGGYAGNMLAQKLDYTADVTLIEPRDKWLHNVAMIRAIATPSPENLQLLDRIIMPYEGLLQRGRIVKDRAIAIDGADVLLKNGNKIASDIIVVATGSGYGAPFKMQSDNIKHFTAAVKKINKQIMQAKDIVIIGAGAVGTELAGELAIAQSDKNLTLITAGASLFPDYPAKLRRKLEKQLADLNIKLRLGERLKVKQTDAPFVPPKKKLQLSDGFPIDADLVIPVTGAKPDTTLIETLGGVKLDAQGRVKTDDWLRPTDNPAVFVAGDIAATGDTMTIVGLTRQVEWLNRVIQGYCNGRAIDKASAYRPWPKPLILVPLGPDKGASSLPFGVVGPLLTSQIKGKKLFIPRFQKEFNWSLDKS